MSDRIQFHSRVGKDGVLQIRVPFRPADAGKDVVVTIAPADENSSDRLAWQRFLDATYGSCAGLGLERPEQGTFEEREAVE